MKRQTIWKMRLLTALLAVFVLAPVWAQNSGRIISGKVVDESGEPLAGAVVMINGDSSSAVGTDIDGKFSIAATSGKNVLTVSMIGFRTASVDAVPGHSIEIVAQQDSYELEGVVFTGYSAIAKKDMTGAVGVVGGKELKAMPVTSVNDVLQGKVAGLTITSTSGTPGAGSVARIRGIGSITGSTSPLYIVDGLPQNGIDYLNPNDIESIAVHKDASVAAIYGSRGANGIIVVTTKNGQNSERMSVAYDGYAAWQSPWKRPYMLNAEQYIQYKNLAADNAGQERIPAFATQERIDAVLNFVRKNTGENGTDWWNEIINRNAFMQNHNVSLSGGSKNVGIMSSLAYTGQDGIVKGTMYQRISWRNNFNAKISKRISLKGNFSIINEKRHLADENNPFTGTIFTAMGADPITPVFRNNLVEVPALLSQIMDGYEAGNLYSQYSGILFSNKRNPVAQIQRMRQSTYDYLYIMGGADLEIKFCDFLKFDSRFGMNLSRSAVDGFQPKYRLNANDYTNESSVTANTSRSDYYVWEQLLSYEQSAGKFKWGALLGTSAELTNGSFVDASVEGLPDNNPDMAVMAAGTINAKVGGYPYSSSLLSFFGGVNFDYGSKYLVSANLRYDGSSKFAKGHKWGLFPSVSAAWRFSGEEFMKSAGSWLSDGKIRASYGHIGNQNIGGGAYMSTWGSTIYDRYNFGSPSTAVIGAGVTSVGNPELMWETSRQFDLGLDLSFFNNSLDFVVDYFVKNIDNMLMQEPQPTTLGLISYPYANVGSMKNEGWEFGINYRKGFGDWFLTASANISTYRNKVKSLGNGDAIYGYAYNKNVVTKTEVGKPVGYFYGYVTNGIFQNAEQVEGSPQRETAVPGDVRYKDLNNDDVIDDKDRTMIGSPWPDFVYGITLGAAWKGFDFNLFIQGSQGNDVMNMTLLDFESGTGYMNARSDYLSRAWSGEGSTDRYHRISARQEGNLLVSDYFLEDGSYARIKNVQLGYDFCNRVIKKNKIISQCRLYLSAQNLFTFTNYSGLDPEIGSSNATVNGIDSGFYPQARVWTVGLNLWPSSPVRIFSPRILGGLWTRTAFSPLRTPALRP